MIPDMPPVLNGEPLTAVNAPVLGSIVNTEIEAESRLATYMNC